MSMPERGRIAVGSDHAGFASRGRLQRHAHGPLPREHNNANVLTLGGRILGPGARHQKRLDKIAAIDQRHHSERPS
jgi:ribose 5-phosphate isomerase RpiB